MSTLDIIIILVGAWAVINGWRKGFVGQIGSIVAIVMAILLSRWLAPEEPTLFASMVPDALQDTPFAPFITGAMMRIAIFVVTFFAVMLFFKVTKLTVKALILGPLDRLAGVAMSVAKWAFALSVVLNLWICIKPASRSVIEQTMQGGKVVETIVKFAPLTWGMMSQFAAADREAGQDTDAATESTGNQ